MARFDLEDAVSSVYERAETIFKNNKITSDILLKIARKNFNFTESQLNRIADYLKEQDAIYTELEDVDSLEESSMLEEEHEQKLDKFEFKRAVDEIGAGRHRLNDILELNRLDETTRAIIDRAITLITRAERELLNLSTNNK